MTKEQIKQETEKKEQVSNDSKTDTKLAEEKQIEKNEVLPEQKITDLEDKLTRTFDSAKNWYNTGKTISARTIPAQFTLKLEKGNSISAYLEHQVKEDLLNSDKNYYVYTNSKQY